MILVSTRTQIRFRRRPTLPHDPSCSTIGAGRLNYRVRYGTGCFPSAKATGKTMGPVRLGATPAWGLGAVQWMRSSKFLLDVNVCVCKSSVY